MAIRERIAKSISQLGGAATSRTIAVHPLNLPRAFFGQCRVISTTAFSVEVQCLIHPNLVSTQVAVPEPIINVNSCAFIAICSDYTSDLISTQLAVPQLAISTTPFTLIASSSESGLFVKTRMRRVKLDWSCKDKGVDLNFGVNVWSQRLLFQGHAAGIRYRDRKQPEATVVGTANELSLSSIDINTRSAEKENNPYSSFYELLYPPPDDIAAGHMPRYDQLYGYQKAGVEFLVPRHHALLADDMGLGKTAQCSIAMHVLLHSERIRRALIICPRALVRQWEREAYHWASLIARPVEGTTAERKRMWDSFPGAIVATPQIVLNDIDVISKSHFDLVVCDDVSMLKNPGKVTTAIRKIPRTRSWCLSGTPMENRPEDFANVMQFVKPNLFSIYERNNTPNRHELQKRVKPFFLRRKKVDCLKDLPPKQLIGPIELQMTGPQWEAYHNTELQQWQQLQALGANTTKLHIFTLMSYLLKICNYDEESKRSAKAKAINEQMNILFDSGDPTIKVIVFSRWVETLNFLKNEWSAYSPQVYYGGLSTSARETMLNWFKMGNGRLLLMSTKAGSRGLNLQESSYVFHFDRTWNPVDEMQAEDRCWRMGQQRSVSVYRYIQSNTIEERLDQVLKFKKEQFDQYVDSMAEDTDTFAETKWSLEELIALMKPTVKK